jgi:recombination protein RecT
MGRITTAVAERAATEEEQGQATATLLDAIVKAEPLFTTALNGTDIDPVQFVSNAVNVVKQDLVDPDKKMKIIECEQESVIGALLNCAQYGLRPGPFKEAWIIPKKKRGGAVLAEFQAHYRGLQRMALAHPEIDRITTRVVHEADVFDVEEGSVNRLIYRPKIGPLAARGPRVAFFALAKLTNGETPFVWWHDTYVTSFRDKFVKAGEKSPWFDAYGYDTMGRKTVLLRLLDEIPRLSRLVDLVAVDGTVRRDLDPATPGYEVGERIDDQEFDNVPEQGAIDLDAADVGATDGA